jgi:hypothetical protein
MNIAHGSIFSDSGAYWTDNYDGSGTIIVASSGSVNTMVLGSYILEYSYTDMAGNIGNTVTRTVTVIDQ